MMPLPVEGLRPKGGKFTMVSLPFWLVQMHAESARKPVR